MRLATRLLGKAKAEHPRTSGMIVDVSLHEGFEPLCCGPFPSRDGPAPLAPLHRPPARAARAPRATEGRPRTRPSAHLACARVALLWHRRLIDGEWVPEKG